MGCNQCCASIDFEENKWARVSYVLYFILPFLGKVFNYF